MSRRTPLHITILQRGLILAIVPFLIQATFAWLVADLHQRQTVAQEQSLKTKEVLLQARQTVFFPGALINDCRRTGNSGQAIVRIIHGLTSVTRVYRVRRIPAD